MSLNICGTSFSADDWERRDVLPSQKIKYLAAKKSRLEAIKQAYDNDPQALVAYKGRLRVLARKGSLINDDVNHQAVQQELEDRIEEYSLLEHGRVPYALVRTVAQSIAALHIAHSEQNDPQNND